MQSIHTRISFSAIAIVTLVVLMVAFIALPSASHAASISIDPLPGLDNGTGETGRLTDVGLGTADPVDAASRLINVGLQSLGLFSLAIFMYGGFLWIWARGNSETIEKAKEIMTGTALGLIFILAAYGITQWIFIQLVYITKG